MARIRTVKPEFWSSPDTASCTDPWARLLYVAMWNWADDAGRGTANPKELAGFAFPNDDDIDAARVRRMLDEVSTAFGVVLYKVGGRTYYSIPSWDDHQKIDRKSLAKNPGPEDGDPWQPNPPDQGGPGDPPSRPRVVPDDSANTQRGLFEDSGTGTGEQGNRGRTTSVTAGAATTSKPSIETDFETWWQAWPRKVSKQEALKAYRGARKKLPAARLATAAAEHAAAWKSNRRPTDKIPHAATWLNGERWNDEIERPTFTVINNPESPWDGVGISTSDSPWEHDMGRTS